MIKIFHKQPKIGQYHQNNNEWIVEFIDENNEEFINPTTGAVGGTSLSTKRTMIFKTKELAIKYLNNKKLDYKIVETPKVQDLFLNSYTKNFI